MNNVRRPATQVGGWLVCVSFCGVVGCGSGSVREVAASTEFNSLKNLTSAYSFATRGLNRPPSNADEIKPYLEKMGDPKALLTSPRDGSELVIQWGTDLLKKQDGHFLVWGYEKNSQNGKRWVLQGRLPVELTDEELRNVPFVAGLKKPF